MFEIGSQVTVVATPDNGKFFRGWKANGSDVIVSTDASYTFELAGQTDLIAVFSDTEAPQYYNVQVVNANPTLGTVSPEGVQQVESGSSVRLTATPTGNASFVGWFVNNSLVSSSETFDYVPAGNGTIAGRFSAGDEG